MDFENPLEETEEMKETIITPKEKLLELIAKFTDTPVDREVLLRMHQFSKKFISDVISRASLLAEHRGSSSIGEEDIFHVVEKEFDYVFGDSELFNITRTPHPDHVEKMAELSRHK